MCFSAMHSQWLNFYPRPPRGGRHHLGVLPVAPGVFLSTPSARRATEYISQKLTAAKISIHALREEGDRKVRVQRVRMDIFLSTPSARRATTESREDSILLAFLSTPSARRATLPPQPPQKANRFLSTPSARRATQNHGSSLLSFSISIHALREEGDPTTPANRCRMSNFYPRPPRGGRHRSNVSACCNGKFLSTPSARRATSSRKTPIDTPNHFYPRPPRGGRRGWCSGTQSASDFYPRPPRGGRPSIWARPTSLSNFYPRPPRGGRRYIKLVDHDACVISIHALREEGDPTTPANRCRMSNFYPRPPRGGRRQQADCYRADPSISIHALREEGDHCAHPSRGCRFISIHALREEGDQPQT